MNLEIVTHCWNYGRLLTYQLSSLWIHAPDRVQVTITVFYADEDQPTQDVLRYFDCLGPPSNIRLQPWLLPKEQLFRRGIGRNLAALRTTADWIWFADCDYLFGHGAIDSSADNVVSVTRPLVFPRTVNQSKTHLEGDIAIERAIGQPRLLEIDQGQFVPVRMSRAIGGIQICKGATVRDVGYIKDAGFHSDRPKQWQRTREDVRFRKSLGTSGTAVPLTNVFRIRHSRCGRHEDGVTL